MDTLIAGIAAWLGIDPVTLVLILGVVVAVCNLLGRAIPDDATGWLGVVRKIAKVLGLYLSNRVAGGVSVNDTARAVAGASVIAAKSTGAKKSTPVEIKLRSPWIVGILSGIILLALTGCTAAQVGGVNTAVSTVCTSAPIAQALYNAAVASGDSDEVNRILNTLQAACPGVLVLIHTIPIREPSPVPVSPSGERG